MTIYQADCVAWANAYAGEPFHALLCDAPYEMEFMGKSWDGSGVAFKPETWQALARVLYDGAFLFVCAGTLNDDLISVAMREAGLVKFHKMMYWAYGSGFPKATRLDTQIDDEAGAEREVIGIKDKGEMNGGAWAGNHGWKQIQKIEAPSTPLAQTWSGHRYGGQALKPACETILIFRKPYTGKPVECITRTGAGALWIDGGRIGTETIQTNHYNATGDMTSFHQSQSGNEYDKSMHSGRWPANFVLTHHPSCNGQCVDGCTVKALGEQSGQLTSGVLDWQKHTRNVKKGWGGFPNDKESDRGQFGGDTGTAARFFYNADWSYEIAEQIANADAVRYSAKAGRKERDAGLENFTEGIATARMVASEWKVDTRNDEGGYATAPQSKQRNPHPTVKPIALMKHLATLLLPPAAYAPRRILVPFAGVASEMIGAYLAGWEEITGIELQPEYCAIGEARMRWWTMQPANVLESMPSDEAEDETDDLRQTSLF